MEIKIELPKEEYRKVQENGKTVIYCTMRQKALHEFACGMWNIGNIHGMDATNCTNYETVKDSAAYLIGRMDERKEGADNGEA